MGQQFTTSISQFNGGLTNDVRDPNTTKARFLANFDNLTYPHRLTPYKSSESGQDTTTRKITDFVYVNSRVYGLGNPSGVATMYYKDTFSDGTWSTTSNNASDIADAVGGGNGTRFLIYYKTTGKIYMPTGTVELGVYDPTGVAAWSDLSIGDMSFGTSAVVHSKDDVLYVSIYHSTNGATICSKNGANAFNTSALVIGLKYVITSLAEYGNYLAIGCRLKDQLLGSSRVFLWDRDSSVATLAESIDWGLGDLRVLEEYEGQLIGISLLQDTTLVTNTQHIFKYYAGAQGAIEFARLTGTVTGNTTTLYSTKQKLNKRIYFMGSIIWDGTYQPGVYSIGRASPQEPFSISLERTPHNDTAVTQIDGFYLAGDYMFIAYDGAGAVSKTDDAATYAATSIYESVKFNQILGLRNKHIPDSSETKKLIGVTITTTPLPSGAQVVLKYKADSESSWTTIMTTSTLNSLSHSAVNIESSGAALPEYKEIQFRIESTGGAEITGLSFDTEVLGKRPY